MKAEQAHLSCTSGEVFDFVTDLRKLRAVCSGRNYNQLAGRERFMQFQRFGGRGHKSQDNRKRTLQPG